MSVLGLPERQPDRDEEVTGPPVKAAYTGDGAPTQAAAGFAKALGISVEDLRVVKGPKGEVIAGTQDTCAARPTAEVLAEVAPRVVAGLHFPKTMRWGSGEHTFVRPVHGVVALFGAGKLATHIPFELFGVAVGDGHGGPPGDRARGASSCAPSGASRPTRRCSPTPAWSSIRRCAASASSTRTQALAAEVGCEVRPDPGLVAEHVELVEYPGVIRGKIEQRFLDLPEEVLITTLRHHQKCLVLTRDDQVAPYFLAVSRPQGRPAGRGEARQRVGAPARGSPTPRSSSPRTASTRSSGQVGKLDRVVFHQKLGSFAAEVRARRRRSLRSWPPMRA